MNTLTLNRYKPIHLCLILSILTSFFIMPATAKAGVLSNVWNALRPVTYLAGRIGGAVAGASLGAAIIPPLGMIVGGVAGWIVGGILTDYASKSLSNLAAVGVGVVGAMALGPSAIGIVGGFLLGGLVGKVAMSLLTKADQKVTGGILFNKAQAVQIGNSGNADIAVNGDVALSATNPDVNIAQTASTNEDVKTAHEVYLKAYQGYTNAVQKAADSKTVMKAKKVYQAAAEKFRKLIGK